MKKTLVAAILALGAGSMLQVYGQGQLSWGNAFGTTTTGVRAPVFNVNSANPLQQVTGNAANGVPAGNANYGGAAPLEGTGFTIALYAGSSATAAMASQTPADTSVFRTGATGAGFMVGPRTATIQGISAGVAANVQFRAWDNRGGTITSWAAVMADQSVAHGASDVFVTGALGGTDAGGGIFPTPQSTGIRSFNLVGVPEPSLIALGALALGGLLLRRRK